MKAVVKAIATAGFYSCGKFWSHEETSVDLDSAELTRLKADPWLIVVSGPTDDQPVSSVAQQQQHVKTKAYK